MEEREKSEGSSTELTMMREDINTFRARVDQLKSLDITMLWGEVPLSDVVLPFEPREDVPSSVAKQSDDVTDEVGDDAYKKTDEDEFLRQNE